LKTGIAEGTLRSTCACHPSIGAVLVRCPSTACQLRERGHFVDIGIGTLGEQEKGAHLLAVLLYKAVQVLLRSPLRVVHDTRTVCASVQRCTDAGRLLLDYGLGEATQLIEEDLLLFRLRLKDVEERYQVTLSGNMHFFPPFA
jgi:hypothetical protein